MDPGFLDRLSVQTDELKGTGLVKPQRVLGPPQEIVSLEKCGQLLVRQ